jgi:type II secretory pathway pseudopilin PulG
MRARRDAGETLVEILLTVVITGLAITALISSLAVAGNTGNVQRSSVQTDVEMRNYAEATKAAVLQACTVGGATYTVGYTPKIGFTVSTSTTPDDGNPTGGVCPNVATTQLLTLKVTGPLGLNQEMDIKVRTP